MAFLRAMLLAVGLASLVWSFTVLPSFRQLLSTRDIAARIISDERLNATALAEILGGVEAVRPAALSPPELLRAIALVRFRLAEVAMTHKDSKEAGVEMAAAGRSLVEALSVDPTDSYLWLKLYSFETGRNGFDPKAVIYLERSYFAGPHEGWIALRRNGLALAVFFFLGDSWQVQVVNEFAEIVDANFFGEAMANLVGIGWSHRDRLLAGLERTDLAAREALARRLFQDGYNVQVPGVKLKERPW